MIYVMTYFVFALAFWTIAIAEDELDVSGCEIEYGRLFVATMLWPASILIIGVVLGFGWLEEVIRDKVRK